MSKKDNNSQHLLKILRESNQEPIAITGSPSTTLDIVIDITESSKSERVLGQMVYVIVNEDGRDILVIGQIIEISTKNRWHEDLAFKGVIKRHGSLPHLSGVADNRIATVSVQACYNLGESSPEGHILGTSPSTGESVKKMDNNVMNALMREHEGAITYIGKVYGTDVDLPFWFKHFDKTDEEHKEFGANDAYHIGVFGKTGSGKTVTAAFMLLGYAKNKNNISILILDPQKQFYLDNELLPGKTKLIDQVEKIGMKHTKFEILSDIYLPGDNYELFGELLANNGFLKDAFRPLYTKDKVEASKEAVVRYLVGRSNDPKFNLNTIEDKKYLLEEMLNRFIELKGKEEKEQGFTKYVIDIFGTPETRRRLRNRIEYIAKRIDREPSLVRKWESALELFSEKNQKGKNKHSVDDIVKMTVNQNGNFIVLDLSSGSEDVESESLQALFVKIIESKIVEAGTKLYLQGKKANCLIVLDEAHRFISKNSVDERIDELTREIIGSVRTTRKYGIGYMFITQTIESLDDEILRQMRIFSFGYGLTSGLELRKVSEIVNSKSAVQLYKSFIDPSSNHRFPFMFYGPISPLSFTGSPLFLEVYTDFNFYKNKNESRD